MNDQNEYFPTRSTAVVERRYKTMPITKRAPSTMIVAGIEFHNPNPTYVFTPGTRGKSGRCTIRSRSQWLSTQAARIQAFLAERRMA